MVNCLCNAGTHRDTAMGIVVCIECGLVLEESEVTAEVGFSESKSGANVADGFFIGANQARAKSGLGGFNRYSSGVVDETEKYARSRKNGLESIKNIAAQVNMTERHIQSAARYYSLALSNKFTKGRSIQIVAAACLYIVCRTEKISNMLMDFSEKLQLDVYAIGSTYTQLINKLGLKNTIPNIDPALFIQKFADKLDFEEKHDIVCKDSLLLVKRMNRDWIQAGRRPAGICAAALFVASRMNGFYRTEKEIVRVVKICFSTLKNRLDEFSNTASAEGTCQEFHEGALTAEANPPSFNRQRTKLQQVKRKRLLEKDVETVDVEEVDEEDEEEEILINVKSLLSSGAPKEILTELDQIPIDDLSYLDVDDEVSGAIIENPEKLAFISEMYEIMNADYVIKNASGDKGRAKKKQKKEKAIPVHANEYRTPFDAVQNCIRLTNKTVSSKLNYSMLGNLLQQDDPSTSL